MASNEPGKDAKVGQEEIAAEGRLAKFSNFLTSLKGIVSSVVTILGLLLGLWLKYHSETPPSPDLPPVGATPRCYTFEAKTFPYLPLSLHPTMRSNEDHMYWLRIEAQSKCPEALLVSVSVNVEGRRLVPGRRPAYRVDFQLNPDREIAKVAFPEIEFLQDDVEEPVELVWTIRRERDGHVLEKDSKQVDLYSKHKFLWGLADPDGRPVAEEFLLAGLSAWALPQSERVKIKAEELGRDAPGGLSTEAAAEAFLQASYEDLLFGDPPEIHIAPSPSAFPPRFGTPPYRSIRLPSELLEHRRGDPLEAALLLAALGLEQSEKRAHLGILVQPRGAGPAGPPGPRILLFWHANFEDWIAVETSADLSREDWDTNVSRSSAEIASWMADHERVREHLKKSGVFYSVNFETAVVDLRIASATHKIRPIP